MLRDPPGVGGRERFPDGSCSHPRRLKRLLIELEQPPGTGRPRTAPAVERYDQFNKNKISFTKAVAAYRKSTRTCFCASALSWFATVLVVFIFFWLRASWWFFHWIDLREMRVVWFGLLMQSRIVLSVFSKMKNSNFSKLNYFFFIMVGQWWPSNPKARLQLEDCI